MDAAAANGWLNAAALALAALAATLLTLVTGAPEWSGAALAAATVLMVAVAGLVRGPGLVR